LFFKRNLSTDVKQILQCKESSLFVWGIAYSIY